LALSGKQKAAMLLMSLDAATAAELLKDVEPQVVQELAVELAYLDASGMRDSKQNAEIARQFCDSLESEETFHFKAFLNSMLKSTVGNEKAKEIQTQISNLLQKRDPFMSIRLADSARLATVLANEHPQATALVLSELPARKSSDVLSLLDEGVRLSAIGRMVGADTMTEDAKTRIVEAVCKRLGTVGTGRGGTGRGGSEQSLRKVAVILRNLGKELQDGLLSAVKEEDGEVGAKVANLMILWEDVPQVSDGSLQEGLRKVKSRKLALALVGADEAIVGKIKANISERVAAAIEEDVSLMSAARRGEIAQAREEIVGALREMNEKGELRFIEE
jgi:flagellar motor switch protein FliG